MSEEKKPEGPNLSQGVPLADIADGGMLLGHAAGEAVLVARRGQELFAIGAECTHYHGPLARVFSLRTLFGVRGITPVLACVPVRRCARRR